MSKEYKIPNTFTVKIWLIHQIEKSSLKEILLNLGGFDTENEINQLNNFIALTNEKLEKAKEEKQKFCPMIIKLSLLFAIGLAIILIWGEYGNYI